jgi:hypothetical protein
MRLVQTMVLGLVHLAQRNIGKLSRLKLWGAGLPQRRVELFLFLLPARVAASSFVERNPLFSGALLGFFKRSLAADRAQHSKTFASQGRRQRHLASTRCPEHSAQPPGFFETNCSL